MTQEQAKSDRKPRARISVDERFTQLTQAKRAEVEKLYTRLNKLEAEAAKVREQWEVAKLEFGQLEGASARGRVQTATEGIRAAGERIRETREAAQ
jgi:hypothetical protein